MKQRILIVHPKYGLYSGAEQFVFECARGLKKYFDLSFCYQERTGKGEALFDDVFDEAHDGVEFFECDLIFVHKCLCPKLYRKILDKKRPVVHMIHDHEGYCLKGSKTFPLSQTPCPYKAGVCCYFPGLAFLKRDAEGHLGFHLPNYFKMKKLVALDQKSDQFIVLSHYMKKTLEIQGYDPKKIHVMLGVRTVQELIEEEKENRIVFAGQLIRGKGLDYLIKALSLITIPCHLDVYGSGRLEGEYRSLVEQLQLKDKVSFHGFHTREEMLPTLAKTVACIFPSVWAEPAGLVGIEMMQLGLPVIAFDNGGVRDWCRDGLTGFLVPPKNIYQLAEKIETLLKDKALAKKLGENAKAFSTSVFNYDHFIEKLATLFQGAIR